MFIVYNSDMELANIDGSATGAETARPAGRKPAVRPVQKDDLSQLLSLLNTAFHRHVHADWYQPDFWLDEAPGWVSLHREQPVGLLVLGADPPPAAWVRLAAFDLVETPPREMRGHLRALLAAAIPVARAAGVEAVFWMSHRRWADRWLPQVGFHEMTSVITFRKADLNLPPLPPAPGGLQIRPVLPEDFPELARIEAGAFAPLWRHSSRALHMAWRQSLSFDVALMDGRLIGFQHSTAASQHGAHLARLTVDPGWQGQGVGTALLARAFDGYAKAGCLHISLNTQADNQQAQQLYRKLGFRESTYRWPLWRLDLI